MSALRPAFFILNLESYISRLNEILRHDLTLSVGEPDNAAAKQGQELREKITGDHFIFSPDRSEERRVGKECRSRWSPYH